MGIPQRALLVLSAMLLFLASAIGAQAQPDPANCTIGLVSPPAGLAPVIPLVGYNVVGGNNVVDPFGTFNVTVVDYLGHPIPNCTVSVDFTNTGNMSPSSVQYFPGVSVTCTPPVVSATTDNSGIAHFDIMGSAINLPPAGTPSGPCSADVYANCCFGGKIKIATIPVVAFDLDGCNGVSTNDLHLFQCQYATGKSPCYIDYDKVGGVTANDLSIMATVFNVGGSQFSGPTCSSQTTCSPSALVTTQNAISFGIQDCGPPPDAFQATYCGTVPLTAYTEFVVGVNGPAVSNLTGVEFQFVIKEVGGLEPYWQFYTTGCHSGGLVSSIPVVISSPNCLAASPAWSGPNSNAMASPLVPHVEWPNPLTGNVDEELVKVTLTSDAGSCLGSVPANTPTPVIAFKVRHAPGSCAGCAPSGALTITPLSVTLTSSVPIAAECLGPCPSPEPRPASVRKLMDINPSEVVFLAQLGDTNIVRAGPTTQVPSGPVLPTKVGLYGAEPNPGAGTLTIRFGLPRDADIRIGIYDVTGRELRRLSSGFTPAGEHALLWDGRSDAGAPLPNGVYFCHLVSEGKTLVRSLVIRR
jgi:hypothetical protein